MSGIVPESAAAVRNLPELGRLLRLLRRRDAALRGSRAATYRELAARTGWSRTVIGDYLTGRTLPPTDRFDILVTLLGATPAERRLLATARDRVEDHQRGPRPRVAVDGVRLGDAPLVGRRDELAGLRAAVAAAAHGRGGVVFLAGEAGIGKTRLAGEAARFAAEAGLRVLRGRAATPTVQFRALSEAVLSVLRRSGPPDDPTLLPYRPALSRLVPEWRPEVPAAAGEDSPVVLAEAVLRLMVALGPGGCLLVLEDLHDADRDTLTVLDYLVDNVAAEPVLVLGTVRAEPGAGLDLVRAARRRRVATVFELARFGDEAVRQLAGGCLDVPPEQVPEPVAGRLLATADGVPLHVEELLAGMVDDRVLVRAGGRWTVAGQVAGQVPVSLVATVTARTGRLDPRTQEVLGAAALLGRRFRAAVVGAAAGVAGPELTRCLRAAVEAQVLVPEGDRFAFRHALTAEALRARMLPAERAALSRRLASALSDPDDPSARDTHPGRDTRSGRVVPPGWGDPPARGDSPDRGDPPARDDPSGADEQLTGELWYAAGEHRRAGELFAAAGRRAAGQGALATAISLLERALSLVDPASLVGSADLVEPLIDAYADAGRVADAYRLGARFAGQPTVHLRLARVAAAAGHWEQGLRELAKVPRSDPAVAARIDATAARLVFGNPTPDRIPRARSLAERALGEAERSGQPAVACDALDTLGRCARLLDLADADAIHRRGLAIADAHNLVQHRVRLRYEIGAHDGIRTADPTRLVAALALANQVGAVETALDIELELAVVRTCRAEYALAERSARRCEQDAERLRLTHTRLIAVGVQIFVAAHQGRRPDLDDLLVRYRELGGERDDLASAVRGFGLACCLLLEEERERALAELRRAVADESARPASYVSFVPGPHLLLAVLAGEAGEAERARMAGSAQAQAGWNRQFLLLAEAVLHGRAGRGGAAGHAMARFVELSGHYPLAQHLGLRLVAEAALADGWGDPVTWLRTAEIYFHTGAPPVARACRVLLRAAGAPVHQHRAGSGEIPLRLRERGVTVREYEVLRLVAERLTNQEIGQRLFLSPRTVEKHVARLLAKTGRRDRGQLADFAATEVG